LCKTAFDWVNRIIMTIDDQVIVMTSLVLRRVRNCPAIIIIIIY